MENILDKKLKSVLVLLAVCASVFFVTKAISEISSYKYIGSGGEIAKISFAGKGEIKVSPDIAMIYFTVTEKNADQAKAESMVTKKSNAILDYLRSQKIDEKDLKVENNSTNQNYEYSNSGMPEIAIYPGRPIQNGYVSSRSFSVKIRKTDSEYVGSIIKQLNVLGVTDLNGPNFQVEDQDKLKEQARNLAIKDAKINAQKTANQVGLKLGRILDFQESGNYPMPMYRAEIMSSDAKSAGGAVADLPTGEDTITVSVTIVYELK